MGVMKGFAASARGRGGRLFDADARRWWFDSKAVMRAVDATARRIMAQAGRMVQQRARWKIRTRRQRLRDMTPEERAKFKMVNAIRKRRGQGPLRPPVMGGSQPKEPPANITGLLKAGIFFAYEPERRDVVIGPVPAGPRTADVLEYGGTTVWTAGPLKGRPVRIAKRPYMVPAIKEVRPKLPALWRDSIKPRR